MARVNLRPPAGPLGRGVVGVTTTAAAVVALSRMVGRIEVQGDSMRPSLLPGDRVLLLRRPLARGAVVTVRDPRQPQRVMVKRVHALLADGRVDVRGDAAEHSTDSRAFGPVPRRLVGLTAVYRYHPPERAGRLRRGGTHPTG